MYKQNGFSLLEVMLSVVIAGIRIGGCATKVTTVRDQQL
ncbi:prepilin-type N-terminal cleavage/methylation domain-containing protein [Pseudoalteromonas sp. KG3]|nr:MULTISPECIES: prepilin-type N-terminal cleavage/methylation domain-containing protein [Pseudoalteromonas]WKD21906.1 prepilin-type N-terminal cleavage/methylation domain-containing protein [Pseudoalteromonas sp. KG3]